MAIIVIGGHSRDVGKTSVVASIIARLPQLNWCAFKITQFGHGFCTANGEPCDCQTDEHSVAVSEERRPSGGKQWSETDSARYLAAGASRSFWVRTRMGNLAAAMPRLRKELAAAENAIIESNSIVGLLRPDLYLSVLDHANADFKASARLFLDRADALLVRDGSEHLVPHWRGISPTLTDGIPRFPIAPPEYMTDAVIAFIAQRLF